MHKVKILSIITGLNTGGAEMMLYKTIKNIDRSKFEPVVVSLLPGGAVSEYIKKENIPVYSLDLNGAKSLIKSSMRLKKIIKKHKPMIIHSYMFHADMLARVIGKISKVPIIISSVRNENIGGKNRERIMKLTDKLTDCVTVVCQAAAIKLIDSKVIKKEKTQVIYNGIELEWFNENEAKENSDDIAGFNILSIGRLHKQKNFPLLIESIADLVTSYPSIKVFIAGEGEDSEKIEKVVKENDLDNHISLLGRRSDINELLNKSDLFVLPSFWEGMPNVVLEAMAASKPVVCTDVGGASEIIENGKTGYLIPSNDKNSMKKTIIKIIKMKKGDRVIMGNLGRKRVEESFSIEETVKQTESLYEMLLKRID